MDIQIKNMEALSRPGIPMPSTAAKSEYVLNIQEIMNLVDTPQLFFNSNPSFEILRPVIMESLQSLLGDGIISAKGAAPVRKGGCAGCARRKLYNAALHVAEKMQHIIVQAQVDPIAKEKLKNDLRSYLMRKIPHRVTPATVVVLYARLKDNSIKRVEL